MNELRIPYPDFKLGEVIDPEQHDLNNGYIQVKVNEIVDFANEILTVGGSQIPIVPPADFTATNIQALFDEIIARLKSTVAGQSGAKLIGTPALNRIAGTDVETQLKFINDLLQTSFVISSLIADGAVITSKIADGAVISAKLGAGAVTFEKLADGSVTATKIVNGSVVTDKIGNFAVTTPKISDGAVTESKLGTSSVGTLNIKDANVTGVKIANRTITGSKIGLSTIMLENLAPEVLAVVPQSVLTARVIALEGDVAELDLAIAAIDAGLEETMANVNTPNNLVKLTNSGKVPNALLPVNHYIDGIVTETTGVANEYIISLQVPLVSYEKGQRLTVFFNVSNTGASTVKINNLPVVGLKKNDGSDFGSGDLKVGSPYTFVYNGTAFFSDSGGGGDVLIEYEKYNTGTKVVKTPQANDMLTGRTRLTAAANNKYAFFTGGQTAASNPVSIVDAYNHSLVRTNGPELLNGSSGHGGANLGEYAVFAGGHYTSRLSDVIAISESLTRIITTSLSVARRHMASISHAGHAIFAGGQPASGSSNVVEAYNHSLTRLTLSPLTTARYNSGGAVAGDYAIVAGGFGTAELRIVDAYDSSLVRITAPQLSYNRYEIKGASAYKNAVFAGGLPSNVSSVVEAYNDSLVRTSLANMPLPKSGHASGSLENYAVFSGGSDIDTSNVVYTYDSKLVRGTATPLNELTANHAGASFGDKVLFGGGYYSFYQRAVSGYQQTADGGIMVNEGDKYKFPDDTVEKTAPPGGTLVSYPYRVDGYVKVKSKKITN